MKILFLSIGYLNNLNDRDIYQDLLREFVKKKHEVYVVCQQGNKNIIDTEFKEECGVNILRVKIKKITNWNLFEKGLTMLLIEYAYKHAIIDYFGGEKFDLVLYSTPPVTFAGLINFYKKKG